MNNSYGNFLIELKRIFNEHSKLLNEFGRSINQFIIKNNEIIQLIDNNEYNKYDNLKYHLKLYDEMYNEIFSNNSYRNIKNEIQQSLNNLQHYKNIDSFNTEHMFMDYRESQNPDESFYKTINDFSDLKKENSSGKIKESTNSHQIYFYSINFISDIQIKLNYKNTKILISQISEQLYKNEDTLLVSINKRNYLNNLIKSDKFNNIINSNENNKIKNFEEIKKIKEIKTIIDIGKFVGKDQIDYKGNSMNFNSNLNLQRGKEIYFPPYSWIGIGLKVIGKYEDDKWINNNNEESEWANAFHPISSLKSINNILEEGLKPGNSQYFQWYEDKRHKGKIGNGKVYLYPNIKMAEENANIININNKKYKIIVMVRVKITEIREPYKHNYWILPPEFIRNYRLLVKAI